MAELLKGASQVCMIRGCQHAEQAAEIEENRACLSDLERAVGRYRIKVDEQAAEIELLKAWMASDERAKIFAEQAAENERLRGLVRLHMRGSGYPDAEIDAALAPTREGE